MMINKGINCIEIDLDQNRHFARKTKGSPYKDHSASS